MKTGDVIASIATPIARALKLPCIDPKTNELRPESPCAKAKNRLNNGEPLLTVIYDRFFEKRNQGEKVKYLIQVVVETTKASDIDLKTIEKAAGGEVLSINPRPTPPQRPATQTGAPVTRAQV